MRSSNVATTGFTEQEDKPYLGNVAVSTTVRRQGVGERLVQVGLRLVERMWKEDRLYVAVDGGNDPALNMYKKLGFEVVLDESQLINRSRMFLEKRLSSVGGIEEQETEGIEGELQVGVGV